jgi:hypothetical protein
MDEEQEQAGEEEEEEEDEIDAFVGDIADGCIVTAEQVHSLGRAVPGSVVWSLNSIPAYGPSKEDRSVFLQVYARLAERTVELLCVLPDEEGITPIVAACQANRCGMIGVES